ncbi:MAG: replication-relaxation family protein [Candidatus Dormibacteraceae bacterium]
MTDRFPVQNEGLKRGLSPTTHACPRPLTDRDLAILLAIDQYRYLDRDHVTDLFFPGRRSAELCLKDLLWRGLIHRWPVMRWQGSPLMPSVYALTTSGARQIAKLRGQDPRPICDRARRAREQTYHLRHDLEANRFFTKLAAGARELPDEGLYHWLGETTCRAAYERDGSPPSDGWGRYLLPDREITFDLEWDRGTEYARRIRQKAIGYVTYFRGRRHADLHHVLFVTPTRVREGELHDLISPLIPQNVNLCRFWTTAAETVSSLGWLSAVWLEIAGLPRRYAFADMPGFPRGTRAASDSIAKTRWWERRPGGGEGA